MKLYYAPGTCSLSPHIVAREAGFPIDLVKTDLKGKTVEGGGDYRKTNPLGYVPALQLDDGSILTEGPAIVQFFADKAPGKNLAPANGTPERYKLQSWLNFVSSEIHKGFSPLFHPAMPEEGKKIARERLAARFEHLNKHLSAHQYLMGKSFSAADAYLFTTLRWTVPTKIEMSGYPNVVAYMKRIEERPAVQAALKAEGLIS
jgi:glutathione S-transferase